VQHFPSVQVILDSSGGKRLLSAHGIITNLFRLGRPHFVVFESSAAAIAVILDLAARSSRLRFRMSRSSTFAQTRVAQRIVSEHIKLFPSMRPPDKA
jgi:hypothetical protein